MTRNTRLVLAALALWGCLAAGCSAPRNAGQNSKVTEKDVPIEVIRGVPARVHLLRVGMTKEEAFNILGLVGYRPMATCMGSSAHHTFSYVLGTSYTLRLTFDETKSPPVLTMTSTGSGFVIGEVL